MQAPQNMQIIGDVIAIAWSDGSEDYFHHEFLRENSPSAENRGEVDILGHRHGGDGPAKFPGVTVLGWDPVGNYGIRIRFSDGHHTGIYSWDYLRKLRDLV